MTITYSSSDFVAAMKGAVVVAYPPSSQAGIDIGTSHSIDAFARFARVPQDVVSPADAARAYWRRDVMPKTMHRLA